VERIKTVDREKPSRASEEEPLASEANRAQATEVKYRNTSSNDRLSSRAEGEAMTDHVKKSLWAVSRGKKVENENPSRGSLSKRGTPKIFVVAARGQNLPHKARQKSLRNAIGGGGKFPRGRLGRENRGKTTTGIRARGTPGDQTSVHREKRLINSSTSVSNVSENRKENKKRAATRELCRRKKVCLMKRT